MQFKIVITMLVIILASINYSIYSKEQHLKQGATVYLTLAPVDPRSLIQGDYMALRFEVTNALHEALPKAEGKHQWQDKIETHDGKILVSLDADNIASYQAIYEGQRLQENELTLNYRVRNNAIKFASNAFFFEEGTANLYTQARYGEFKVNAQGGLLLNAMFDEELHLITP
ncbi:MAG: GDYXXLXY domain-containing protein [Psychromonas sp.]|nr:GDYXXLXY domain-containing protein [Psychromonas sp.]